MTAHAKHEEHETKRSAAKEPAKPAAPRYENGQLTYEGMQAVLAEGGSVLYGGKVVTSAHELPSQVDLVRGKADQEKALEDHLDAEIGKLTAQKAKLKAPESKKDK